MNSVVVGFIVFFCLFAASLLGMFLRKSLPRHHLTDDSKDAIKLGMALISTMSALVLGLLVSSAKSSYDAQNAELMTTSANIVMLDRLLAHYGPETAETRSQLRESVATVIDRVWTRASANTGRLGAPSQRSEMLFEKIEVLTPKDENQKMLKSEALALSETIGQTRWLQFAQATASVPLPLLLMLVSWLTMLFIGLGMFAPRNGTVIASLVISELAVAGAILLILEFYTPYRGLIEVSSAPLRAALAELGK
jgi:hypothetical protein